MAAKQWALLFDEVESLKALTTNVIESSAGAKRLEGQERITALATLQGAADQLLGHATSAYSMFRAGREALYEAATLWGVTTGRDTVGKPPKALGGLSVADLAGEVRTHGSDLKGALTTVARGAQKATDKLSSAAREDPEDIDKRRAVIDAGLDMRTKGHEVFAHMNGLLRRAHTLVGKVRQIESINAYRPAWFADPEIGDREL